MRKGGAGCRFSRPGPGGSPTHTYLIRIFLAPSPEWAPAVAGRTWEVSGHSGSSHSPSKYPSNFKCGRCGRYVFQDIYRDGEQWSTIRPFG